MKLSNLQIDTIVDFVREQNIKEVKRVNNLLRKRTAVVKLADRALARYRDFPQALYTKMINRFPKDIIIEILCEPDFVKDKTDYSSLRGKILLGSIEAANLDELKKNLELKF